MTNILPIPECLKHAFEGNTVERMEDVVRQFIYHSLTDEDKLETIKDLGEIADFYRQPFTLEMLQEYFGAKEYEYWDGKCYIIMKRKSFVSLDKYDLEFRPLRDGGLMVFEKTKLHFNKYIFEGIKTLSDFISDCKRNGITLTWRSE